MNVNDKLLGGIYGGVLGDIYGLKYEGCNPNSIDVNNILNKTFYDKYSDDTEHLLIMINCIKTTNNLEDFNNKFMNNLRKWLFTLPYGIGKSTLKSIIKSFFTSNSGVKSTGNGALMRSGIIGLFLNELELEKYIKSNCILTHNHEDSINTSIMFAKILNYLLHNNFDKYDFLELIAKNKNNAFEKYFIDIKDHISVRTKPEILSKLWTQNKGAYGYTIITLALSIYTFLYYQNNFEEGMKSIISCGGDTDTNAFVYGMISGTSNGLSKIDNKYIETINNQINLFDYLDNKKELNYLTTLINNLIITPLIFLEIFKRYFFILINKKI